jgi:hypothetical protein
LAEKSTLASIVGKTISNYFEYVSIPTEVTLAVIILLLGIGLGASVWEKRLSTDLDD